jgi:hypothetical protein
VRGGGEGEGKYAADDETPLQTENGTDRR